MTGRVVLGVLALLALVMAVVGALTPVEGRVIECGSVVFPSGGSADYDPISGETCGGLRGQRMGTSFGYLVIAAALGALSNYADRWSPLRALHRIDRAWRVGGSTR